MNKNDMRLSYNRGRVFLWKDRVTPVFLWLGGAAAVCFFAMIVAVNTGLLGKGEMENLVGNGVLMLVFSLPLVYVALRRGAMKKNMTMMVEEKTVRLADQTEIGVAEVAGVVIREEGGGYKAGLALGGPEQTVRWMEMGEPWRLELACKLATSLDVPVFTEIGMPVVADVAEARAGYRALVKRFIARLVDISWDMKFETEVWTLPVLRPQAGGGVRLLLEDPRGYFRKAKWQNYIMGLVILTFCVSMGVVMTKFMGWEMALFAIPVTLIAMMPAALNLKVQARLEKATWFVEVEEDVVKLPNGKVMKKEEVEGLFVCWRKNSMGHKLEVALAHQDQGKTKFETVMMCVVSQHGEGVCELAYELAKRIGTPVYFIDTIWPTTGGTWFKKLEGEA